jgi:type I restriction enzyme S subunit
MRDPRRNPDTPFLYVDISAIDRSLKVITSAPEILGADSPSRARKEIREGDILVSTVRPNLNAVAVVPEHLDGQIASTGFCVLRPDKSAIVGKYLFYFTTTPHFVGILSGKVRGAHYPAVSDSDVKEIELPLPTVSEQQRIVEILDQADALRKKRAEADAKAARILPALFYKMFGDPLALISSGEGVPLSELEVDLQNGFACGEKDVEDGVPHLRMNNIDDAGVLNLELVRTVPFDRDTERYRLMEKDVLFMGTNSEDKIVKTCLFLPPDERTYLFSNHLIRLRVSDSRITPEYLAGFLHLLWSKRFFPSIAKRWVNQSAVAQSSLAALRIPLPGERSLQVFTTAFQNLLSLRAQRVRSGETLNQTFAILLHRAFTGDLTAKWREAHMEELLAEMEAQAKALDCPSTQSNSSEVRSKRHAGHDMFNKAALAAYITDRCHAPDRPMGRVKLAKLFYLVQQKAEIELTETFMKRAAGPLDDEIHKFLSLAQKSKWLVLCRGEGDLKPVKPGANVSKAVEQAQKLLGPAKAKVDEMLDQMKGWGYRALERWATVLDASFELTAAGQPATVEGVKDIIQRHPDWVPKLSRDEFSDTNIEATLKGLRGFGFITNQY